MTSDDNTAGPMRAAGILRSITAALELLVGRTVDESVFPAIRLRIYEILDYQSSIRSVPKPPQELCSVRMEILPPDRVCVYFGPDWVKDVDRHLGNRDCRLCGGLVAIGFSHDRDECNLNLARDVINS